MVDRCYGNNSKSDEREWYIRALDSAVWAANAPDSTNV